MLVFSYKCSITVQLISIPVLNRILWKNRIQSVKKKSSVLLLLLVGIAPLCGFTEDSSPELYSKYCSVCHGDQGDGRSRAQGSMIPPPRNFTSPQSAMELSRERMILSVTEGRPGTAMTAWKNQLSEEQIASIVDYILLTMMRPIVSEHSTRGRRLYAENCSVCHGDDGKGARWTLSNLKPPPRNFTLPGTADHLTEDHMLEVVKYGKADTAMPGFATQLTDADLASVVDYIRSAFMEAGSSPEESKHSADLSHHSEIHAAFPSGLKGDPIRGQAFYQQNCVACHGLEGDGKGPRAYFIFPKPRNFRHPAARHGLNRARLYSAIALGSRGTDMPAWEKVLTAQEIADLTEYVFRTFILGDQSETTSSDKG